MADLRDDARGSDDIAKPCGRLGHDYEFMGERHYDGERPGYMVDEFYCRRCLHTEKRKRDSSDKWYSERRRG